MKIPTPIGEQEYECELNRLVAQFERDMAKAQRPRRVDPDTIMGRLYRAFVEAGESLTAVEASDRAGIPYAPTVNGARVQHLEKTLGLIERCGYQTKTWKSWGGRATTKHRVWLYRPAAVVPSIELRATHAIKLFNHRVEKLEMRRAVNLCLVERIDAAPLVYQPKAANAKLASIEEKQKIVERRLRGETMRTIADDYGITRERVRQIVERAAFPRPRKVPKGVRIKASRQDTYPRTRIARDTF